MKRRMTGVCLTLIASLTMSAFVMAQDATEQRAIPRYVVLPPKPLAPDQIQPAGQLQTWNGNFTYNNHQYNYVMVGADPSTNTNVSITTYLIPIVIKIGSTTFDPAAGGAASAMSRTVTSPIFDHTTTYTQGGVNVGTTQYVDAFQRGNFWSIVQDNPQTHVLLAHGPIAGPSRSPLPNVTVLPTLTLTVPSNLGFIGHPFGPPAGEVDINYFDGQINDYINAHSVITPGSFPIFLINDVYLTQGGCCIGGYHSATGAQTYSVFDYDDHPGVFSQDVSALSHEVSEWMDDPLTNGGNGTPCGILEVGDPLEGEPNFGGFPYVLHGFTYNLQDEVFIGYFGAPLSTSVNSWYSFQNFPFTRICQNGS